MFHAPFNKHLVLLSLINKWGFVSEVVWPTERGGSQLMYSPLVMSGRLGGAPRENVLAEIPSPADGQKAWFSSALFLQMLKKQHQDRKENISTPLFSAAAS